MMENHIFKALADPTRRIIFEKLANANGMNASALREGIPISQPAMSQHLAVLRDARLVQEERRGRFVNYRITPEGLDMIVQWVARYSTFWPDRVDALRKTLKEMDQ
ncbi:helix-turn-helix transcriptional regulator [Thalassospira sp. TSL5-1]|uniref:ArsR/SmtB family transcription factor n=1 Tax=Thalassospira sp. TSL5-1 TaxID=1544451 RepID=UPI00093B4803|nr:metalloregulator ArsR/SmtB family transcription factor [Thalassospira sp. TSL5-1]OKH87759.1 ArsR family transcriptional regulator [Thalassospira sp. TSL5-1]